MSALALQSFIYEASPVRVVMIDDKPWLVAADVAVLLGFTRSRDMVRMLKDHQKGAHQVRTPGGEQSLTIISEGGLYKCILRSKRPEAERFGDWVTDELLPTLRLTGRYEIGNDDAAPAFEPDALELERLKIALAIAESARRGAGRKAWRQVWDRLGLPDISSTDAHPALRIGSVARLQRTVAAWLGERTEGEPGHRVTSKALYDDYLTWCVANEEPPLERLSYLSFGIALTNAGVPRRKGPSGNSEREGLKLRE